MSIICFENSHGFSNRSPVVILVIGKIGAGKTILSTNIALRLGIKRVNSDEIRKLAGINEYTIQATEKVYNKMANITEKEISAGRSIVLDATFYMRKWRFDIINISKKYKAPIYLLNCDASKKVRKDAVIKKRHLGTGVSSESVRKRIDRVFEAIKTAETESYLGIVGIYRNNNVNAIEIKSHRPWTRILALLAENNNVDNKTWKRVDNSLPFKDEINNDVLSAINIASNTGAISVYLMGSLVANEFSYCLYHGNQYNLSDYDFLFFYKNSITYMDERKLLEWKQNIEVNNKDRIKRRIIGFQCHYNDNLPKMNLLLKSQFYLTGKLIYGKEIREYSNIQSNNAWRWEGDEAKKAWLFRLRVIALRLYSILHNETDPLIRDIVTSYYIVRAGVDLSLCGCLDNRIIPKTHHEAVSLIELIEGNDSEIYRCSSICLRIKMLNEKSLDQICWPPIHAAVLR